MALDDILKKIKKETEEKIKEIEERNREEVRKLEEKYRAEIEKRKSEILAETEAEVQKRIQQTQIRLNLETKNLLLQKKQEILDNIYQEVLDELSNLSDSDYQKLILNLLKRCPERGEIIPAQNRERVTEKAIAESKKKFHLAKKSLAIKGGFIFSSENLEIDNSFENLIKIIREKTEIEVSKILFG
ncbi:MAG: V-type ATP synthase subunit E [Patescibacteria group bacterium]|nr:V-type ATP synthase subunit E [Patescibacteria group bacterium]